MFVKLFALGTLSVFSAAFAAVAQARNIIEDVSVATNDVFVKVTPPVEYKASIPKRSSKLVVDFANTTYPFGSKSFPGEGLIKQVRLSQYEQKTRFTARLVVDLSAPPTKDTYMFEEKSDGVHIIFGTRETIAAAKAAAQKEAEQAQATAPAEDTSRDTEDKMAAAAAQAATSSVPSAAPEQEQQTSPITSAADAGFSSKHVTLNLQGMPLVGILAAITKQTGASFVISKDLQARQFTALMENVSLRDALRALLEVHGLAYEQIGTSNTFVVKELAHSKMRLSTRVFKLRFTQLMDVKSKSLGSVTLGQMSSGNTAGATASGGGSTTGTGTSDTTKVDASNNNFLNVIQGQLSEYGTLHVYPETNSLVVSDLPENLPAIEELIEELDVPAPQVMIEAYFVETNASNLKNLGIAWGDDSGNLASFQGNSALVNFPLSSGGEVLPFGTFNYSSLNTGAQTYSSSNFYGNYSFGILSFQELTAALKAIESTGDGQYLAKPKVLTLNNKAAEISITQNTVVQFETKQFTGSGYLGQQSSTPIRQMTGITLWVTPQVNDSDMITLTIAPEISVPAASTYFPSQNVLDTERRAISTTVRVKNGSTVLIGGLLNNQDSNTVRKVPILGHLPIIGALFTSTSKTSSERELLIFITPHLVND
jgi:type IV pilus secretin PilQ/predicted competence protein